MHEGGGQEGASGYDAQHAQYSQHAQHAQHDCLKIRACNRYTLDHRREFCIAPRCCAHTLCVPGQMLQPRGPAEGLRRSRCDAASLEQLRVGLRPLFHVGGRPAVLYGCTLSATSRHAWQWTGLDCSDQRLEEGSVQQGCFLVSRTRDLLRVMCDYYEALLLCHLVECWFV